MHSFITSTAAFVFAIAVLIAFHEFGHYWVARRCGVKVLRFSIGFGKALWMKRHGADQTEYAIAAIPLGGYVKMLDEREGDVAKEELHRAFNRQPVHKRIAIVAAGPIFNLIFAVFAYTVMYVIGVPGVTPLIGEVTQTSIAESAGIHSNDEIVSVEGENTPTWASARMALLQSSLQNDTITLQVRSKGLQNLRTVHLPVAAINSEDKQARLMEALGIQAYFPEIPAVIGQLSAGDAGERDGFLPGDKVVSVNGEAIKDWEAWVKVVRANPEKRLSVEIERQGSVKQLTLTPAAVKEDQKIIGRIGALPQPVEYPKELQTIQKYSLLKAVYTGAVKTWQMAVLTLKMIGKMIVGEVSVKNLSGPITIATYAGFSASEGLPTFLSFLAIVSISLGVLNFLPIPLLDGGHLLFYAIEIVKGKSLSDEVQAKMQHVGIVMLGLLMVLAFYNDIHRLFWG